MGLQKDGLVERRQGGNEVTIGREAEPLEGLVRLALTSFLKQRSSLGPMPSPSSRDFRSFRSAALEAAEPTRDAPNDA
jgi:hypothetical protein